ncbi:MAG: hypothetical protein H8D87_00615 [Deltaproteobacteria bacterium]|nr:hypothetical protein [Candidatus Desulfobacula maris]
MTDLKKKYENQTIGQIEKQVKSDLEKSIDARKDAILTIYYLKTSSRYKENPLYAKSSFKVYLGDVYMMRENSFNESVTAFLNYPKESARWSVGLVSKVRRDCGAKKEKEVFKEIKQKEKDLKTPIKREQIQKIIESHTNPKVKGDKKPEYKTLYTNELRAHQATKERLTETINELKSARDQIEKLKITILSFRYVFEEERELEPVTA